jgi:hypothetical protein
LRLDRRARLSGLRVSADAIEANTIETLNFVIAGLVPAIHNLGLEWLVEIGIMDGRHKAGQDGMMGKASGKSSGDSRHDPTRPPLAPRGADNRKKRIPMTARILSAATLEYRVGRRRFFASP